MTMALLRALALPKDVDPRGNDADGALTAPIALRGTSPHADAAPGALKRPGGIAGGAAG